MRTRTEPLLALALLGLAGSAQALTLQFKPSVHAEVQRDDNIFRVADDEAGAVPRVGDTLTTLGAGARLTLRESLQELELRGEYDHVDYADLNQLDYDRHRITGEARLVYASLLKLKLDAGRERRQEGFEYRDDTAQSFVTIDQASAELRLAVTPRWTGIGKAEFYDSSASRVASQDNDLTERTGELGAEYRRNGYSSLGLALRVGEGEYPKRVVTPGDGREKDYEQQSLVARAGYTPSGLSDFAAQLAYTRRRHDDAAVPDFKGITGRASYTRRFSGVSQAQLEAYRDLFYVQDINANYVENIGVRAAFDYRWSAKLAFAVAAERYDSSYKGTPAFSVGGQSREDEVWNVRLGADYQPFYRFSILPEYRYEQRDSNTAGSRYDFSVIGVDFSYEYGVRTRR